MDGTEMPVQETPQQATIIIRDDASQSDSDDEDQDIDEAKILQQNISNAAALGWATAELLGRCYVLPEERPAQLSWNGDKLIMLQETFTPREKIRALMEHILYLADALDLGSWAIDNDNDPDNNKLYLDVLTDNVTQLCEVPAGPGADQVRAQLRGKINERLFFWDLKIQDALQNGPTLVLKAYIVGRSIAALRWYFGQRDYILHTNFLEKLCQKYIPVLAPYVSPFTTEALAYSVENWGKAIYAGQVTPGPDGPDGKAPPELQKQADIWFCLLTCERAALTYLDPSVASRPYILRVLGISWPLFIVGIVLLIVVLAIVLFVLLSHLNLIVTTVTTAGASLAALGITHSLMTSIGGIIQQAMSGDSLQKVEARAVGIVKVSMIDSLWNSSQQKAVNKAIYIAPAPPAPAVRTVAQNPQM